MGSNISLEKKIFMKQKKKKKKREKKKEEIPPLRTFNFQSKYM